MSPIISRKEAIAYGLKRFYTGVPCKKGHDSYRRVCDYKCGQCVNEKSIAWIKSRPERRKEAVKKYEDANREKIRAYHKKRRIEMPEFFKEQRKKNYPRYKAYFKEYGKRWIANNRDRLNRRTREYYAKNINAKISLNNRGRIKKALMSSYKTQSSIHLLGCTVKQFRAHLISLFKPGMTWKNHGRGEGKWQIDHIIPCNYFDLSIPRNQMLCFNWRNCQPLWSDENIRKSDSLPSNLEELLTHLKIEVPLL